MSFFSRVHFSLGFTSRRCQVHKNIPGSADILTPCCSRISDRVGIRIWYLRQTGCSNSSLRLRIQKKLHCDPLSAAKHPSPRNRQILFPSRTTSHSTRSRFPQSSQCLPPSQRDPKPPNSKLETANSKLTTDNCKLKTANSPLQPRFSIPCVHENPDQGGFRAIAVDAQRGGAVR